MYSNVQSWMMYAQAFTPNKSTITEILSSGKLHLFKNKELKKRIIHCYDELYTSFIFRQNTLNEFTRILRTEELIETYRLMNIMDNNGNEATNIVISNPKYYIEHEWLKNKQSAKYLKFENYLILLRSGYLDNINSIKELRLNIKELVTMLDEELRD